MLGVLATRWHLRCLGQFPRRHSEDPQTRAGQILDGVQRGRPQVLVGQSAQHGLGRALDVHDEPAVTLGDGGHQPQPGIETEEGTAAGVPAGEVRDVPETSGAFDRGPPRSGSPRRDGCSPPSGPRLLGDGGALGHRPGQRHGVRSLARPSRRRPPALQPHAVARECAGLVGADHVSGAERLDGAEPFDHRALPGQQPYAECEREGDGGQQSLGDVGHQQAHGEDDRVRDRQAGGHADDEEDRAQADGHARDQPGDPLDLVLEGALLPLRALAQRGDASQFGVPPGGEDDGLCLSAHACGAAEDEVRLPHDGQVDGTSTGRAFDGRGLSRQHREVHFQRAVGEPASAGTLSPSSRTSRSPGTRSRASTVCSGAVPDHGGAVRQVACQRFDGAFGLPFLQQREAGVQHDDGQDRAAQRGRPRDQGEACRAPQQTAPAGARPGARVPARAHRVSSRRTSFGPCAASRRAASRPDRPCGPVARSLRSRVSGSRGSTWSASGAAADTCAVSPCAGGRRRSVRLTEEGDLQRAGLGRTGEDVVCLLHVVQAEVVRHQVGGGKPSCGEHARAARASRRCRPGRSSP